MNCSLLLKLYVANYKRSVRHSSLDFQFKTQYTKNDPEVVVSSPGLVTLSLILEQLFKTNPISFLCGVLIGHLDILNKKCIPFKARYTNLVFETVGWFKSYTNYTLKITCEIFILKGGLVFEISRY